MSRLTEKGTIRLRHGLVGGVSILALVGGLAGGVKPELDASTSHESAATAIHKKIEQSLTPLDRQIQSRLDKVDQILAQGDNGDQTSRALKAEQQTLGAQLIGRELERGQGANLRGYQREEAAARTDRMDAKAIGGASTLPIIIFLGAAAANFGRRRR